MSKTPSSLRVVPRRGLRVLFTVVVTVVVVLAVAVVTSLMGLLPGSFDPFGTRTTDRSQPVVLRSVQDLSRFVAAAGNYELIVDLEKDAKYIPSFLYGGRTLFVAAGTVDAYVEFGGLHGDAVKVSADQKTVTITLPQPSMGKPNIDHNRSYVYSEERGLVNRLKDFGGGDANRTQQLYLLAEQKISASANDGTLAERARTNARSTLTGLLRSLGFTTVTVEFAKAP
ncbi:DUF4230 domain-containing protein [Longispora sp. NPDC051575]|uniref:DUF4230 domain-containing protein n=1 Tax=Longispora sp. NPDC051575 TaxID=3154943 RepID=UPI00343438F0